MTFLRTDFGLCAFLSDNAGKQHVFSNYSLTDILQYDRLKAVPERIHNSYGNTL